MSTVDTDRLILRRRRLRLAGVSGHGAVSIPPGKDYVSYLIPVRFRRGVVRETQRTCHLVPVSDADAVPTMLTALYGQQFMPGQTERLAEFCAMPVACLVLAAWAISQTPA